MSIKNWVCDPDAYLEPRITSSGMGASPAITVMEVFKATVAKHGDRTAMCLKRKGADGKLPEQWKTWTWKQYYADCFKFAKSLISLDIPKFHIINMVGFNSPEWLISNNGAILAGDIAAGIYTSNLPEACKYISQHSKADVVVVEDNAQLLKYSKIAHELPDLKAMVIWSEAPNPEIAAKFKVKVHTWEEWLEVGKDVPDAVVEERMAQVRPGNCSTLIYTSGTTGPPKAVMLSHDNVTWTSKNLIDNYLDSNHTERFLSYLPLSHIAAQMIDIHAPMYLGACTYFAQPDALKGSLTVSMKDCRPTIFFGVPRVWEKIQEKMVQIGRESKGIKKSLATWAKGLGADHCARAEFGGDRGSGCGYGCASSIVLSKIKEALGLDQAKACFTAAAPISVDTLRYFSSIDIPIYEVFGQSECTGPHTVSNKDQWKIGYCGRPMLGTETMIAPGTNELCYRGRHIFMGYMYMPDKTAETIDDQGYLHSGDVAEFDDNADPRVPAPSGFMKITGRIKELIITAGGENIPPVLIENEMKAAMVALSNCMVVGDRRKFLTMLVSLKCEVNPETGAPTDRLAADALFVGQQIGSEVVTMEEAAKCPKWKEYIDKGVKEANKKTTSNAQVVQKWVMLPVDFSEKAGDLTPTLKLKRNVVSDKYAQLIENMYADVENL